MILNIEVAQGQTEKENVWFNRKCIKGMSTSDDNLATFYAFYAYCVTIFLNYTQHHAFWPMLFVRCYCRSYVSCVFTFSILHLNISAYFNVRYENFPWKLHLYRATLCIARSLLSCGVRLSVALVYCVETVKLAIKRFSSLGGQRRHQWGGGRGRPPE